MKIALYGGSFNPPHISHIFVATYIAMMGRFDRVYIYPCFSSPTGKKLIDFNHRLNMCELAFGYLPNVIISLIEEGLPKPSFTVNTVKEFKRILPKAEFELIVGSDIMANQHLWKKEDLEEIYNIAPPFVIGRSGVENNSSCNIVMPDVSSTNIREMISSNNIESISQVLPASILEYIIENKLYV